MRLISLAAIALVTMPVATVAQDVEMLGERYGTVPPAGYFAELIRDTRAFSFGSGRPARFRAAMEGIAEDEPGPLRILGPRNGPVIGTFRIPVIFGLFSDSPEAESMPFGPDDVRTTYFGSEPRSVTDFYAEVSGGRVELLGDIEEWARADVTREEATGGKSGLVRGTTGVFIKQVLAELSDVDWGLYDNDGPDGVPNSGDDDGKVDALAVMHPTRGGECGGLDKDNRIWAHKWRLSAAANSSFVTSILRAGGSGFIQIDDYFIQGVLACGEIEQKLNEIGVFTHEVGHAFGLPDLYDTNSSLDGKHGGAGNWDLMSSGSWGCNGQDASTPCHLGAWSKEMLGWANVTTVAADIDLGTVTLPPVETSGEILRIDAGDGSREYFLLENRQRLGFDEHLFGEGLLIWHIDQDVVQGRWGINWINALAHRGVWLRQADGRDDLGNPSASSGSSRGDGSDPFPGLAANTAFHAVSTPAATSVLGTATGLTLIDIESVGDDVTFRLLTRFPRISMRAEGGEVGSGLFSVDGAPSEDAPYSFTSVPFVEHSVEAANGDVVSPGIRNPFTGWADDPGGSRSRTIEVPLDDMELVALYSGRQVELSVEMEGGQPGIDPAVIATVPASPDLWFTEGAEVAVEAVTRTGFDFLGWTGALAGQPNPTTITMAAPVQAGANFTLTYAVPDLTIPVSAATEQDLQLEVENGNAPIFWTVIDGELPGGIQLFGSGSVTGAALELGSYPVTLQARDALGLTGQGEVTFVVEKPEIPLEELASWFLAVGPQLDHNQRTFLDRQGNGDGSYDLGDFRAWVLDNPGLPFTANFVSVMGPRTIVVPMSRNGVEVRR